MGTARSKPSDMAVKDDGDDDGGVVGTQQEDENSSTSSHSTNSSVNSGDYQDLMSEEDSPDDDDDDDDFSMQDCLWAPYANFVAEDHIKWQANEDDSGDQTDSEADSDTGQSDSASDDEHAAQPMQVDDNLIDLVESFGQLRTSIEADQANAFGNHFNEPAVNSNDGTKGIANKENVKYLAEQMILETGSGTKSLADTNNNIVQGASIEKVGETKKTAKDNPKLRSPSKPKVAGKVSRKRPAFVYLPGDQITKDGTEAAAVQDLLNRLSSGFSTLSLLSTFGNPKIFWLTPYIDEPPNKRRKTMDVIELLSDSSDDEVVYLPNQLEILKVDSSNSSSDVPKRTVVNDEERTRKRILTNQKLYNFTSDTQLPDLGTAGRELILDRDEKGKVLVQVDPAIAFELKEHQREGVKFMYETTVQSVAQLVASKGKNDQGKGCILAHSMGLGKTFQVISYLHTILNNKHTHKHLKRVLIIVPSNVARNWVAEIQKWNQELKLKSFPIYELFNTNALNRRVNMCREWHQEGGIMIVTITIYHILALGKKLLAEGKTSAHRALFTCLVDPGPDVVVIDEGHLIKNDKSLIHEALSNINTRRRVLLTGTPMQNNLSEYYTMVNFVRPKLLGSLGFFKIRFQDPIKAGQVKDCSIYELSVMKKRVHVLHRIVSVCIHRADYNVLVPYLPPKKEYVLELKLTELQKDLYQHYLSNFVDRQDLKKNLFKDYTMLGYIWNHPYLLDKHYKKRLDYENKSNTSLERSDFVSQPDHADESAGNIIDNSGGGFDIAHLLWPLQYMPDDLKQVELSSKYILLFSILDKCQEIGDKLVIFSQSLNNFDLLEEMLRLRMEAMLKKKGTEEYNRLMEKGVTNIWMRDTDYYRLDGSVPSNHRMDMIKEINDVNNLRARLILVSTRAGGLGINLVGANRCIIFDASWNPANDLQAVFRIFRYGQQKPVYIYRFAAYGTMENKIYRRQIVKQSLSHRVVDEQQIMRHYKKNDLEELYQFEMPDEANRKQPIVPTDLLLANMIEENGEWIVSYHEHDSLLENRPEEELSEEERKAAWVEYDRLMEANANASNAAKRAQDELLAKVLAQQQQILKPVPNSQPPPTS